MRIVFQKHLFNRLTYTRVSHALSEVKLYTISSWNVKNIGLMESARCRAGMHNTPLTAAHALHLPRDATITHVRSTL